MLVTHRGAVRVGVPGSFVLDQARTVLVVKIHHEEGVRTAV